MQLSAPFAALATVVLSAVVLGAPHPSPNKVKNELIPVVKRNNNSLLKSGTNKVDFDKVNSHLYNLKTKYTQAFKNYQKNTGKTIPNVHLQSLVERGTGTDSLVNEGNSEWAVPMTWGGQQIYFDLDTGSANTAVNKDSYSPSSNSQDTGKSFTITYADGTNANCEEYDEDLTIAGLSARGSIGKADNDFIGSSEAPAVGIAGMAYPNLASGGQTPFFDSLQNAGSLDNFIFTIKLANDDSTLYLGGVDPASSNPTYAPVTSQGFWQLDSTLGGISTEGFIDSGTSLIVAPPDTAKKIFDNLQIDSYTDGSTTYGQYDCNNPPTVTFTFGSYSQDMSSDSMNMGTHDGNCVLSIIGVDIGYSQIIYGDPLMRNVYVTFDREQNQLGFSPQ